MYNSEADNYVPSALDHVKVAFLYLKNAIDANAKNDPYQRNHFLTGARQELEAAGENMAVDFLSEFLDGHAYFSHVVPVIYNRLKKDHGFADPVK